MAKVRQGLRKSYFILQSHMLMHAFCEHFVTGQAHLMFIQGYVKVKVMSRSKLFQGQICKRI